MIAWTNYLAPRERKDRRSSFWPDAMKGMRRCALFIVGLTLIGFGILLLPSPVPGILFILAGLLAWASEFLWARRLLVRLRRRLGIDRETFRKAFFWRGCFRYAPPREGRE